MCGGERRWRGGGGGGGAEPETKSAYLRLCLSVRLQCVGWTLPSDRRPVCSSPNRMASIARGVSVNIDLPSLSPSMCVTLAVMDWFIPPAPGCPLYSSRCLTWEQQFKHKHDEAYSRLYRRSDVQQSEAVAMSTFLKVIQDFGTFYIIMELLALCLQPLWVLASCQNCCLVGLFTGLRQKEKQGEQRQFLAGVYVATNLVESLFPFETSQQWQGW